MLEYEKEDFILKNFVMQGGDDEIIETDNTLEGIMKKIPKPMYVGSHEGIYKLIRIIRKKSRKETEIIDVEVS